MYHFKENIDWEGFFCIDKKIITGGTWAELSLSGKAVLPVIIRYRNKKGIAFPSLETISILAGISEKTASSGIKSIEKLTNVGIEKYRTTKGNISYKYFIPPNMIESEAKIRMNNSLFDSGCWRMLNSSGKALYVVLLTLAEPDRDDYEICREPENFNEWYSQREYDFVNFYSKQNLIELSGISRPSLSKAIKALKKTELLQNLDDSDTEVSQKIYIKPAIFYERDFLNSKIQESFQHKQKKL